MDWIARQSEEIIWLSCLKAWTVLVANRNYESAAETLAGNRDCESAIETEGNGVFTSLIIDALQGGPQICWGL